MYFSFFFIQKPLSKTVSEKRTESVFNTQNSYNPITNIRGVTPSQYAQKPYNILKPQSNIEEQKTSKGSYIPSSYKAGNAFYGPDAERTKDWNKSIISTQRGKVGLYNLGNTCYMNAALQCMIHNPCLILPVARGDCNKLSRPAACAMELFKLIKYSIENSSGNNVAKPLELKRYMGDKYSQFSGSGQQDSIEFVHELLELLSKELNRVTHKIPYKMLDQTKELISIQANKWYQYNEQITSSLITDIFQGQLFNTVKCKSCGFEHISFDNFFSLSLSLPKASTSFTHSTKLDSCLQNFVREEKISSDVGYKCTNCKKIVDITKQTIIWRLPSVLIVHLKRFYCSTWRKEKLDTLVEFDIDNFDLKPYCGSSGILRKYTKNS